MLRFRSNSARPTMTIRPGSTEATEATEATQEKQATQEVTREDMSTYRSRPQARDRRQAVARRLHAHDAKRSEYRRHIRSADGDSRGRRSHRARDDSGRRR